MAPLKVFDATGTQQQLKEGADPSGNLVGASTITDPANGNQVEVNQRHTADGANLSADHSIETAAVPMLFNGVGHDRARSNFDAPTSLLAISNMAAGSINADQVNYNGRGVQLGINVTAITGTNPTLVVTIRGRDAVSGQYYNLLSSVSITATGFTRLVVYPGIPTTANVSQSDVLPRTWNVLATVGGTGVSVTATIGASVIH